MQITTIGLDIAKNVFQVHGIDAAEKVIVRKQLRRGQMLAFFKALPPCLVGMEACATSHYWARELTKLGHQVRLMPAKDVKAYVKRNKNNDAADAQAICEAVRRPSFGHIEVTDGRVWLKQSGVAHFAGDLPEAEQKLIYATQGAPRGKPLQPKGRWHGVEVQAELVCPRQGGPDRFTRSCNALSQNA